MHTIIISKDMVGMSIAQIIESMNNKECYNIKINECFVTLDKKIVRFGELQYTFPNEGQELYLIQLAVGG